MKRTLALVAAVALLLTACGVSPQSQQALIVQQQQCTAGDQDACTAANYQAQANQAEAANNNAVAATVGLAVLSGVAAGAAAGATVNSYRWHPLTDHRQTVRRRLPPPSSSPMLAGASSIAVLGEPATSCGYVRGVDLSKEHGRGGVSLTRYMHRIDTDNAQR